MKSILLAMRRAMQRTVQREHREQEQVEIDITELAPIWLVHNTPHHHQPSPAVAHATSSSLSPDPTVPGLKSATALSEAQGHSSVGSRAESGGAPAIVESNRPPTSHTAARESWPSPLAALLQPYHHQMVTQGVLPYVDRAIHTLTEHGAHPSLVMERGTSDPESKDLYSLRDSLGKVSLLDHTIHVVEATLELLRQQYREHESHAPRAILAALAHDLGKIPAWRQTKMYGKQDHASISALKLREWLPANESPWWLDSVVTAVREHHRRSNDSLGVLLKRADMLAREREVAAATAGLVVQAFPAWMHADRWRELVAAEIDMLQKANQWLAFTHHGVVYAKIDLLLRAARAVMTDSRAVDLLFLADSERERASARLVRWLKEQAWLADEIGDGYYGLPYDIEMTAPHQATTVLPPHYLVPLRVEVFGDEGSFRHRKAGVLALITGVRKRPLGGS